MRLHISSEWLIAKASDFQPSNVRHHYDFYLNRAFRHTGGGLLYHVHGQDFLICKLSSKVHRLSGISEGKDDDLWCDVIHHLGRVGDPVDPQVDPA